MSGKREISPSISTVIADLAASRTPDAAQLAEAVRELLRLLAAQVPGRAVEVRVPPYGAVQCGAGPRHTRGTPPAVVETDPATWCAVATGRTAWDTALAEGRVRVSGARADLAPYLPVVSLPPD